MPPLINEQAKPALKDMEAEGGPAPRARRRVKGKWSGAEAKFQFLASQLCDASLEARLEHLKAASKWWSWLTCNADEHSDGAITYTCPTYVLYDALSAEGRGEGVRAGGVVLCATWQGAVSGKRRVMAQRAGHAQMADCFRQLASIATQSARSEGRRTRRDHDPATRMAQRSGTRRHVPLACAMFTAQQYVKTLCMPFRAEALPFAWILTHPRIDLAQLIVTQKCMPRHHLPR